MLGVDLSREGTGTPRANHLFGVFTLTWFSPLQYFETQVDPSGQWRDGHRVLRSLLGYGR